MKRIVRSLRTQIIKRNNVYIYITLPQSEHSISPVITVFKHKKLVFMHVCKKIHSIYRSCNEQYEGLTMITDNAVISIEVKNPENDVPQLSVLIEEN